MNNTIKTSIIAILLAIAGYFGYQSTNLGGFADVATNRFNYLTDLSTTTAAVPIKLLDADYNRRYAIISNPSDTGIYLFATSTNITATQATTYIAASGLTGIYVAAGTNYEINPDNTFYGYLWASTTAPSKKINVSYK